MNNETKIPLKVIENWFKERLSTTMKNFQANQPDLSYTDPDDQSFLTGAWNAARVYLETEYEAYIKATEEVKNVR